MVSTGHIHQLDGDAEPVIRSAYTSFQDRAHIQLFTHDARVNVFSLGGKGRTTRHDVKLFDLRQRIDGFFGHPVCNKFVLRVRAHAGER